MEAKKWYESKTILVALLLGIAGILAILGVIPESLIDQNAGWVGIAISVIQVILRLVTKKPIAGS